jgi:hypothetical protein
VPGPPLGCQPLFGTLAVLYYSNLYQSLTVNDNQRTTAQIRKYGPHFSLNKQLSDMGMQTTV